MKAVPKMLTVTEVGDALRISTKTLYRWVYERKIPFVKLHGKLLFEESSILRFIEACRVNNPFPPGSDRGIKRPQSSESDPSRKGVL
jgi:excisionase family DNA binding protein